MYQVNHLKGIVNKLKINFYSHFEIVSNITHFSLCINLFGMLEINI